MLISKLPIGVRSIHIFMAIFESLYRIRSVHTYMVISEMILRIALTRIIAAINEYPLESDQFAYIW